jgi:hypothetical protein
MSLKVSKLVGSETSVDQDHLFHIITGVGGGAAVFGISIMTVPLRFELNGTFGNLS